MIIIKKNEATATLRRMYFHCVDSVDGMTPELGEAGGQSQISVGGGAWANTTNVLVAIGNGRYYVELTQAEVNIADRSIIEGRYKSANTTETIGSTIQVLEFVPDASISAIQNTLKIKNASINDVAPSKTKFITTLTETNNDYWNSGAVLFTSGVNAGQIRSIKDYVGSTKEITLNTGLINTPGNGDAFSIVMLRAFRLAGLEAQEIRDAMKLVPSAGDPATGSVDKHLDDAAKEATVAGILGDLTPGVLQSLVTVTKNSTIKRGDVVSMTFLLGSGWNITGKKVYYMAKTNKEDANSEAIFEKTCTIVDATTATCDLTITDTATAGEYYHEIEVRDTDGTSNPRTAIEGTLEITEDVRK